MNHYVLFTGGRDVDGPEAEDAMDDVVKFLHLFYGVGLRIMHGDAPGVDTIADEAAKRYGVTCKAYPYDRGRGKVGPLERNEKMGRLLIEWERLGHTVEVIAFPGGRGTAHMMRFADQLGLPVTQIPLSSHQLVTTGGSGGRGD